MYESKISSMLLRTLNAVFDDKRIMVAMVWCWLIVVLCVFTEMVRDPNRPRNQGSCLAYPDRLLDVEKYVRCLCHNMNDERVGLN